MHRSILVVPMLVLLVAFHVLTLTWTASMRSALPRGDASGMVLPSPLLRITSLGFKGLIADFIFLDVITYYGGTLNRTERPHVKEWEWTWFEKNLQAATDLDPHFLDPYYFGNAIFTWEGRQIAKANRLLEKGSAARTWDWMLPFFAGFNYFYFLEENEKAADRLMEASRRPGANPLLASLASRLAFKEHRTEASIQFLEETLKRIDDEAIQDHLKMRIMTLRHLAELEKAVLNYRERYRRDPRRIGDLVAGGMIKVVPEDPFGGEYYLTEKGTVKSSSDRMLLPASRSRGR